jgi:CBS domain-containing protein
MPTETPVKDVMSTQVITLRPEQTFEEAADILADNAIGAAPVVDGDGKVVGLLRDEDLIVSEGNLHVPTVFQFMDLEFTWPGEKKRFEKELKQMVAATVKDLMDADYVSCSPDDSLGAVASKMHDADVTHMPVVGADGKLVGIIARGDIVRRVADTT